MTAEQMWSLMLSASEELAAELGLEAPPKVFTPRRALDAVDAWLAGRSAPLEAEDAARLGFFLARVLVETHGGGLVQIAEKGHPLRGEWAVAGCTRGLPRDYHVPFVLSAAQLGVYRDRDARTWYAQVLEAR